MFICVNLYCALVDGSNLRSEFLENCHSSMNAKSFLSNKMSQNSWWVLWLQGWMPCESEGLGEGKALNVHVVKSCRSTKPSKNVSNSQPQGTHGKDDNSSMLAQVESLEILQTQQTMCICFNGKHGRKMTQQLTLTVFQGIVLPWRALVIPTECHTTVHQETRVL